ncbi:MAG: sulfur reduction protein DsrJ [Chromatiaceae bacterium]|nr:sulfur reduction protein DsrJ [Chromatiaceae bacterium]
MANAFIRNSLLAIGLTGVFVFAAAADFEPGNHVVPGSEAAGLEHCVRETGFMRRNHMELILHQRHVTVHEGIRDTKYSLGGCVACHVSYDEQQRPVSVYADGQFCHACHEFAAVDLSCFGCHATVPAYTDAEAQEETVEHARETPGLGANPASATPLSGVGVAHVQSEGSQGVGD